MPTTSGPSARYSSASLATCASPISWISWALRRGGREVAQGGVVGLVAAGQPAQAAPLLGAGLGQRDVAQSVAVGLEAGPEVLLDGLLQGGPEPRRRRPRHRA